MNLSKHAFSLALLPLFLFGSISIASAQSEPGPQLEPSYEIALHVVIGSNDTAAKGDLPSNLSNITRYLKGNFSFTNYWVANTILGRISNTGTVEYKSVTNLLGMETDAESQTFLEWNVGNFRALPTGFQARSFRFGARIPIRSGAFKDGGTSNPVVSYESVGLNMSMIGLPANRPTLVGTISLPRTSGTLFLVATVRTAEL